MKHFFATLLVILFASTLAVAIFLLNIYFSVLSPAKIKTLAGRSNAYETASFYIKESVIEQNHLLLNDSQNLETLDETIQPSTIRPFIDHTIDSLFLAIKKPTAENMSFTIRFPDGVESESALGYVFEKNVNLEGNSLFFWLSVLPKIILGAVFLSLFWLFLLIITSTKVSSRLKWLGSSFLVLALLFGSIILIDLLLLPNQSEAIARSMNFLSDLKLQNGLQRLVSNILGSQTIYLVIETVSFLLVSCGFFYLGSLAGKDKLDLSGIDKFKF